MNQPEARDDEREALVKAFADAIFHAGLRSPESTKAVIALKSVLAAHEHPELGINDEVLRAAGYVKIPDRWVYGSLNPEGFRREVAGPWSSRDTAEQFCFGDLSRLRKRRVGIAPGPWVPVGEGEQ